VTVKSDLEKAIAQAQSAEGTYATFANSTEDPVAKQLFQQMEMDMKRHVEQLNGRLNYITMNNKLNGQ
jgi:rubrerythrin